MGRHLQVEMHFRQGLAVPFSFPSMRRNLYLFRDLPYVIDEPYLGVLRNLVVWRQPFVYFVDSQVLSPLIAPGLSSSVVAGPSTPASTTRSTTSGRLPGSPGLPAPSGPKTPSHLYLARTFWPVVCGSVDPNDPTATISDISVWWFICWSDWENPETLNGFTGRTAHDMSVPEDRPVFTYTIDPDPIRHDPNWGQPGPLGVHGDPRRSKIL